MQNRSNIYGKGLNLVMNDNAACPEDILRLSSNRHISFKVCALSMKNNHIEKDQLICRADVVLEGIYDIITKQK